MRNIFRSCKLPHILHILRCNLAEIISIYLPPPFVSPMLGYYYYDFLRYYSSLDPFDDYTRFRQAELDKWYWFVWGFIYVIAFISWILLLVCYGITSTSLSFTFWSFIITINNIRALFQFRKLSIRLSFWINWNNKT